MMTPPPPSTTTTTNNTNNPHALSEAQEEGEMFDVMEAPSSDFDMRKDRPIPSGRIKARRDVHRDGDWHRSVHIWLVDYDRGLVGLQKRSLEKDTFPGRWDISAAGHVEAGVTDSRETALRELAEELGISTQEDKLQYKFTCPGNLASLGGCNCFEDVYFFPVNSETIHIHIGIAEVTDFQWISITEYEQILRSKTNEQYVPRVDSYMDAFFLELKQAIKL